MEFSAATANLKSGESLFLSNFAKLGKNAALGAVAGNSTAMVQGVSIKIAKIEYGEIPKGTRGVPVLEADQIITNAAGESVTLGKKGDLPWAAQIYASDSNRTMTMGLFTQGGKKTTIALLGQEPKATFELNPEEVLGLVGKTIKCTAFFRDETNVIVRAGRAGYPANCYTFEEVEA